MPEVGHVGEDPLAAISISGTNVWENQFNAIQEKPVIQVTLC